MTDNSEALLRVAKAIYACQPESVETPFKKLHGPAIDDLIETARAAIAAWNTRPSSPASDGDAVKLALALADAEAEYRRCHDYHGPADMRTGRAWDKMRRRGDYVREALSALPPSPVSDGGAVREALEALTAMVEASADYAGEDGELPLEAINARHVLNGLPTPERWREAINAASTGVAGLLAMRADAAKGPFCVSYSETRAGPDGRLIGFLEANGRPLLVDEDADGFVAPSPLLEYIAELLNWFDANVDRLTSQPSPTPTGSEQ